MSPCPHVFQRYLESGLADGNSARLVATVAELASLNCIAHVNKKIPNGVAAIIVGGILFAFGSWAYFGDTSLRQARRMKLARQNLPAITNAVYAKPEFRDVRVGVGTGAGGCFLVFGVIDTEKNLSELQRTIAAQQPPVTVVYQLKVLERYSDAKP